MRRAYWSLWLLVGLYVVSLCSEVICNDVPLYVRFNGRGYFPVFRFQPESEFTGSDRETRPNYKRLLRQDLFAATPGNFMIFPPVPFGPYEIIEPDQIEIPDVVRVGLEPSGRVGAVNVRPDYRVAYSRAADVFLRPSADEPAGEVLTAVWEIPASVRDAVSRRFANEASPAVSVAVSRATDGLQAELCLSPYEVRARAPDTVRILFREVTRGRGTARELVFSPAGEPDESSRETWESWPESVRAELAPLILQRVAHAVEDAYVTLDGLRYRVRFDREEVRYPFRPVGRHWLGLDSSGRDVLARVLYGLRTSMTFGLILVVCSIALGILVGAVQGFFGGWIDLFTQRGIEIWSALPFLYVMILLGSVYGRSLILLIVCYGLFNWIGMSYYMRAEFLRLRRQPYVEAARCLGLPARRIIFRHILPNALIPVVTFFPFSLVGAVSALAALDYLGFGLPPPTPSWGELLHQAQQFRWAWWLILYPSLALFTVMLLGVFIGEGVRNAYDPRRYSRME
jgi:microcin C transport system permease protein